MKINSVNSTSFQSRNKTIRFADDIARRVNVCYPRVSSTLVDDFINVKAFRQCQNRLYEKISDFLRKDIGDSFDDADNFIGKILALIKPVKKYKVGNCGESAQLANIVAKVNGIKNCYIASLKTTIGKNLDHSVLYVNDEKPYVIDAWLGFADYVPNAMIRYNSEFKNHFFILKGDKLTFKKLNNDFTKVLNQDFSRAQVNKLKKIYPEHVIKRGYV